MASWWCGICGDYSEESGTLISISIVLVEAILIFGSLARS
jgi:hypothetical protein